MPHQNWIVEINSKDCPNWRINTNTGVKRCVLMDANCAPVTCPKRMNHHSPHEQIEMVDNLIDASKMLSESYHPQHDPGIQYWTYQLEEAKAKVLAMLGLC